MNDQIRKSAFDRRAEAYDEARPGYPQELFERLLEVTKLEAAANILEIGCGTGQATEPLVKRGYSLLALEPGQQLASLARDKIDSPQLEFVHTTFEDWDAAGQKFALIIAAQSFHWIDLDIARRKVPQLLQPDGFMALVWNVDHWGEDKVRKDLDTVYQKYFPREGGPVSKSIVKRIARIEEEISAWAGITQVLRQEFPWRHSCTASQYVRLLQSYSDDEFLEGSMRDGFYTEIGAAVRRNADEIIRDIRTLLLLYQRQ